MRQVLIGVLIGILIGGVLTFLLFVGVPRASAPPGVAIKPPEASGPRPGAAEIVLRQEFFNSVLETIFRDMNAPTFPLTADGRAPAAGSACPSQITVLREGSGVQTVVRFDNNTLSAPIAFSGAYESMFGCIQFTGWAQATLNLRYDAEQKSVFGQLNIDTVNLDGVNPVVGGIITPLVQSTLNTRVNPVRILDQRQIEVDLPIAATNGNLKATVSDVRAEIKNNELDLYLIYDFQGAKAAAQ